MLLYITPILFYLRVPQRGQSCLSRLESRHALTLATTLGLTGAVYGGGSRDGVAGIPTSSSLLFYAVVCRMLERKKLR